MAENNTSSASGGVGVLGLLGVAFVVLKLCHVINWPWIWVLAPFWGGLLLGLSVLVVVLLVVLALAIRDQRAAQRRRRALTR